MYEYKKPSADNPISISELNKYTCNTLESLGYVWAIGEISNISKPRSGHIYFSLKDSHCQVNCAYFKNSQTINTHDLKDGTEIIVRAKTTIYAPRGSYQLVIEKCILAGDGVLKQKLLQLKHKLEAEGLFAQENKLPFPPFPNTIGVITSLSAAALRDICKVLKKRYPYAEVLIYPCEVQGKLATDTIVQALDKAYKAKECDVLILSRGGGSIEDLWCFNEQEVAYALARRTIPTVTGVGHETDTTIVDYVADYRAPTPSAAAAFVVPDQFECIQNFINISQHIQQIWQKTSSSSVQI